MRIGGWLALVGVIVVHVSVTYADGPEKPDDRVAKADRLFSEGKALLDTNLLQACAKFDESYQVNPAAIGTLLNVALCDEKLGRIASAYQKFSEARVHANEQNLTEHVRAAEQHMAALEPQIPHLTIKLTEDLPDTKVLIDDKVVARADITNLPIDPGERVIVVSAPGRLPYQTKIIVAKAKHADVVIPALDKSVTVRSSRRRLGQIGVIAGGGVMLGGLGLALYARAHYNDQFSNGQCVHNPAADQCTSDGQAATNQSRTFGNVATVLGVVGVVAVGVGAYLWLQSPKDTHERPRVTVLPQIDPSGCGVVALGSF